MKKLQIFRDDRHEIVLGYKDNDYMIILPFATWSTNDQEQKKLNNDPRNLETRKLANKILSLKL